MIILSLWNVNNFSKFVERLWDYLSHFVTDVLHLNSFLGNVKWQKYEMFI